MFVNSTDQGEVNTETKHKECNEWNDLKPILAEEFEVFFSFVDASYTGSEHITQTISESHIIASQNQAENEFDDMHTQKQQKNP